MYSISLEGRDEILGRSRYEDNGLIPVPDASEDAEEGRG